MDPRKALTELEEEIMSSYRQAIDEDLLRSATAFVGQRKVGFKFYFFSPHYNVHMEEIEAELTQLEQTLEEIGFHYIRVHEHNKIERAMGLKPEPDEHTVYFIVSR